MQNAWKVGLFMILFTIMLLGAYQILGQRLMRPETISVIAEFPDAGGINPGARVLMAGVKVGEVEKVELAGPTKARLHLRIEKDKAIPKGSMASLPTSLIGFGDNPILIQPPLVASAGSLANGDVIQGTRLGALEGILPDMGDTMKEVNATLKAVRKVVENQELQSSLVAVLQQSQETLAQFSKLAGNANSALAENRGSIRETMQTFALAMKDVQKSAAMAADLLADPRYKDQAAAILENLGSTTKKADQLMASIQTLVEDPILRTSLTQTASNVSAMTDSGTRIAANTEKITENGVEISQNVSELTAKVNDLADEAKGVFEKIKNFFERTPSTNPLGKVETQMDITRQMDPGRFRADFQARVPLKDGSVHVGIYDAFESNDIIAQFGKPLGKGGEYRYGVYAGQPGLGVDWPLAPRTTLRADAYGLNDPRLDLRVQYRIRNDLLGWLGFNQVGDRNRATVGIGIRR